MKHSISEDHGIAALTDEDLRIYCVGISTAGSAEVRMARGNSKRQITTTTVDKEGAEFVEKMVAQEGLSNQISVKLEDVSEPLPYEDQSFDFIYARLVLHYLAKADLERALAELFRILRDGGRLFVVVRALEDPSLVVDPETGYTTYSSNGEPYQRYFQTVESIRDHVSAAGFNVTYTEIYEEHLCHDFYRKLPSKSVNTVIELLSSKAL